MSLDTKFYSLVLGDIYSDQKLKFIFSVNNWYIYENYDTILEPTQD